MRAVLLVLCVFGCLAIIDEAAVLRRVESLVGGQDAPVRASRTEAETPAEEEPAEWVSPGRLAEAFDVERAMGHIHCLSETIGPRPLGSIEDREAAAYIVKELAAVGWGVEVQKDIELGGTSLQTQNIIGVAPAPAGRRQWTIIAGAHYDSSARQGTSPGANDNASGVAVLLEMARALGRTRLPYHLRLVFFGGEEATREVPSTHHVGSDYYVAQLNEFERAAVMAMISVDMVAGGTELRASRLGYGTDRARNWLLEAANDVGAAMGTVTGRAWSDHEAFELAAIPSVWLTRMGGDDHWHTARDTVENIDRAMLEEGGGVALEFLGVLARDLEKTRVAAQRREHRPGSVGG